LATSSSLFTIKEEGKGTGLGLSVVSGIIDQRGGWIDIDSSHGNGTVLNVYFPAAGKQSQILAINRFGKKR
jgi:signal transduction histidine kinase